MFKHFRHLLLLTLIAVLITIMQSDAWAGVAGKVRKAGKLYNEEKYDEALELYDKALSEKPDEPVIQYNRAAALYRNKSFAEAAKAFIKSLASGNEDLEERAVYNTGNSEFRIGEGSEKKDTSAALTSYKKALEHYKRAVEIDSGDMDAKYNYEFTLQKIKQLKNQEQQKQQQEQQDQQQKEQEQQQQQEQKEQEEKKKEQQEQEQQQREKEQQQQEQEQDQFPKDQKPDTIDEFEGEMSEEQAEMLLRSQDEEEARMRAEKRKAKRTRRPPVLKDW